MWLPLLALVIGFVIMYLWRLPHLSQYSEYLGVAMIAGLDSVVGAVRSYVEGKFNDRIFVTGFFTNAALAAALLFVLGTELKVQWIAVAIMVALFIRIFNNFGFVRRYVVARIFEKRMSGEKTFPEP